MRLDDTHNLSVNQLDVNSKQLHAGQLAGEGCTPVESLDVLKKASVRPRLVKVSEAAKALLNKENF